MNVSALRKYLESLAIPMQEHSPEREMTDLREICRALGGFDQQNLSEMAEFLKRAQNYESEGHWPDRRPPIAGNVIDAPTPEDYAERLRNYLRAEVPTDGPVPEAVRTELKQVEKNLKAAGLKLVAKVAGAENPGTTAVKIMQAIFKKITNRDLTPPKKSKAVVDEQKIHDAVNRLKEAAGTPELENEIAAVNKMVLAEVRAIGNELGAGAMKSKAAGIKVIREILASPDASAPKTEQPLDVSKQLAELDALKQRADQPGANYDQIESELQKIEAELDRDEAIDLAEKFTGKSRLSSRNEAMEAIRWKLFEARRVQENYSY